MSQALASGYLTLTLLLSDKQYGERPIILAVVGLSFLSQMRGSNNVNGLLYTERKFGWSVTQYTNYKSFYVSIGTVQYSTDVTRVTSGIN